jgi:hypothetical protein
MNFGRRHFEKKLALVRFRNLHSSLQPAGQDPDPDDETNNYMADYKDGSETQETDCTPLPIVLANTRLSGHDRIGQGRC